MLIHITFWVGIEVKDLSRHIESWNPSKGDHELLALRKPYNPDYSRRIVSVIRLREVTLDKRTGKMIKWYLIVSLPFQYSTAILSEPQGGDGVNSWMFPNTREHRGQREKERERLLESQWHETLPHRRLTHDITTPFQHACIRALYLIQISIIIVKICMYDNN